jgi:hypothetical protein
VKRNDRNFLGTVSGTNRYAALSIIFFSLHTLSLKAQDSLSCEALQHKADSFDTHLSQLVKATKDTVVHFLEDETNLPGHSQLHTDYYVKEGAVRKSVEQSATRIGQLFNLSITYGVNHLGTADKSIIKANYKATLTSTIKTILTFAK